MNYCQVEIDTAKHYKQQEQLEAAQDAAEKEAVAQVEDPKSIYFWANSENIDEALCESITPKHNIKNGLAYQDQLKMLITTGQYEAYGKLCESISREYWTAYVLDLVS
jgi:hypothetical protein